jgi:hypothetical protein
MDFLRDPDGYDHAESWASVIAAVGGERSAALAVLSRACADSPVGEPHTLDLAQRVDALEAALGTPNWEQALAAVRDELRAAKALPDAFDPSRGDPLAAEVGPWAAAARTEAEAGLAAVRLIQQVNAGPEPESAMQTAFFVLYMWQAARADENVVFGPRFAIYTPVVQMADGAPALDIGLAVREDANVIDRLCRLALATYDAWRIAARTP